MGGLGEFVCLYDVLGWVGLGLEAGGSSRIGRRKSDECVCVCMRGPPRLFYGQTLSFDIAVRLEDGTFNSSLDDPTSPYFSQTERVVCSLVSRRSLNFSTAPRAQLNTGVI